MKRQSPWRRDAQGDWLGLAGSGEVAGGCCVWGLPVGIVVISKRLRVPWCPRIAGGYPIPRWHDGILTAVMDLRLRAPVAISPMYRHQTRAIGAVSLYFRRRPMSSARSCEG